LIGNVVEKYEVIQKIGEGGMATVYRGRHVTLGREVAIKVLHPHLSASERNRQRFAREARAIEHLEHDNILKIFDYSGTDTEKCYIVTEFIDGITLQELLNERVRFPSEVAIEIGIKLALALDYAHGLGIIHRDLKLENVMIRRDGTLKLMDFGIARFLDEVNLTITGALIGSPAYMSPEQAMERVLDSRSDLFSLGTLLFHLVTGQLPFTGANPSIVLRNVIEAKRPGVQELAPDVSANLADIIEQLMQTEPEDRPTSAQAVADRLGECLAEVGVDEDDNLSLPRWLQDPKNYDERLTELLTVQLLETGKARLAERDHLGALRMFNRLLSMDDQNEEVLTLIRGMHGMKDSNRPRWRLVSLGIGLLLLVGTVSIGFWPDRQPSTQALVVEDSLGEATPQAREDAALANEDERDAPPAIVATDPVESDITPQNSSPPPAVAPRPTPQRQTKPSSTSQRTVSPATVLITVPGSWGDIFIDGDLKGRTGAVGSLEVSPGTHVLGIRNDHALPWQESFTVAPGERKTIEVTNLQRKPARFRMTNAPSPKCTVTVDGIRRGTIESLANSLQVRAPQRSHDLTIQCPDGTTIGKTIAPAAPGALVQVDLSSP